VLDLLRSWRPPFNPQTAIGEASAILREWGLCRIVGDRYAPGFVVEAFKQHGIAYEFAEQDRSTIYLDALPLVNSGQALLLDHPELLKQARTLERRRGTGGRDRCDHRPGAHDDLINAAAGALVLVRAPIVPAIFTQRMVLCGEHDRMPVRMFSDPNPGASGFWPANGANYLTFDRNGQPIPPVLERKPGAMANTESRVIK
jgi:hypothetical protein